ncbi:MAG: TonB-dependent receptor plug domain-containing protein, partial [Bacteroidales bacterium]|nr:TonB-dependent receptor plug domain-containing protein [Bacteroidales bacterium]
VIVEDKEVRKSTLTRINPQSALVIPTVSGGIEALVKTMPGVSSNNELSSQYSVRGGNFDENLVYINGIEVYRPILTRSGQQEGLSVINSHLVSSILFSAGGFDAKYGDKMSSVLDIKYRKPTKFAGSADISLLGGSFHFEGVAAKNKLTYLVGFRQKSNQYLLNSLDTKGEYKPSFTDIQALLGYRINKKWKVEVLGNYARNSYKLVPENRETSFGHIKEAYQLKIYFDGQEIDRFDTWFGAVTTTFTPNNKTNLKLIGSAYQSFERENYDIQGQYWIGRLETNLGDEEFGEVVESKGVGTYLNHARNKLNATVYSIEHQGIHEKDFSLMQWGIKLQHEDFEDRMREWEMIDSAGYTSPNPGDSLGYIDPGAQPNYPFVLFDTIISDNKMTSNRLTAYIQNNWDFYHLKNKMSVTVGARMNYWGYNQQLLLSPRAAFSYQPEWEKDMLFRFAAGLYYQSPFYKELRRPDGSLNPDIRAQQSIHFVAGSDYNFIAWNRPFKLTTEVYYKHMDHLIPFIVENVRIIYSGENSSRGYATGIDTKINGEFVPGVESWMSISVMQTNEILRDNYYNDIRSLNPDAPANVWIPRPTDQRVTVNIFFQDYLPMLPNFKMNMNLAFGTGLPVYYPNSDHNIVITRTPPYRRVDIGFAYEIIGPNSKKSTKSFFKHFTNVDLTFEVLNLLDIKNVVSYLWVKDNQNYVYLVPNYLTPRQLNLKLAVRF